MSSKLPEEDLSCPVCCDIFSDPVLLPCSHSFCRSCLQKFWFNSVFRSCPVCRRRTSKKQPPSNLALRNLCEAFVQTQNWSCENNKKEECPQHGEKLKLFCVDDQHPICVVCQASRMHKGHNCTPTDEAALDCKVLFGQTRFVLRWSVATLCPFKKIKNKKCCSLGLKGFCVVSWENAVNQVWSDTISVCSGGGTGADAFQQHLAGAHLRFLPFKLKCPSKVFNKSMCTCVCVRTRMLVFQTHVLEPENLVSGRRSRGLKQCNELYYSLDLKLEVYHFKQWH